MAEAFELYASFKIDTSGYTQELNKIRQEMEQFQQELNSLAIHPTFDGGRFRTELQPKRLKIPKNPVLTTTPNPSLKGRRPLTYAIRRAVDRLYVKKGLTTRSTYFFRNSDSRYT